MSTKKSIEITINAKGEVVYEMKGMKGTDCFKEAEFLQQALGGDAAIVDQQKTSEFYEQGSEGYVSTWSGGDRSGDE